MPAPDLFRGSFVGQVIYYASGRRLLQFQEEKPNFVVPSRYLPPNSRAPSPSGQSDNATLDGENRRQSTIKAGTNGTVTPVAAQSPPEESTIGREYLRHGDVEKVALAEKEREQPPFDPYVVEWYGPDDKECPYNVRAIPFVASCSPKSSSSGRL